ncbi:GNAT family N-acetyltransferase [Saccharothrix longispora]|uniref:RimJ/RimL family protein N-acetyltransferase n=1 Tax=Saccharothrix longispora TaxID=33920 RepID=A0ABU1Q6D2_9PSEU|nr:GNAT family N-acetyltransferase [Saccharothrix longispora]MDR6597969.1 RimJ/RimL family protein N-acetyltransferase [Saccharothrix longispora]
MRSDSWHLTDDVDEFLARAGDFLRSRPDLHTMTATVAEKARTRGAATSFGWLESGGGVRALFHLLPSSRRLNTGPLSPGQADALAARLADRPLAGVTAVRDTAAAFAEAWRRHTGATPVPGQGVRLHRLGALTPPEPAPAGRARAEEPHDRGQVVRWCHEFMAAVDETPTTAWADSRYADKHYTFWETPDGTPVSMAGSTSVVAGMARVDPVYTPAHLRGRGYAAAVTVAVSRAALDSCATHVVLFTDPGNATSNALYRRIGYVPVADFAAFAFSDDGGDRTLATNV